MLYSEDNISIVKDEIDVRIFDIQQQNYCEQLTKDYEDKLYVNKKLNRGLISFQANKTEPFYRWFKYKEGFSSAFVKHILKQFGVPNTGQIILDPFAGIGTTMTTSIQNGFDSIGIELLAPGILATQARIASEYINKDEFEKIIQEIASVDFLNRGVEKKYYFKHLTITKGAFPEPTEIGIANFQKFISENCDNENVKSLLIFAVSSVLEDVSYTRKDGQYLRWDFRSPRKLKSKFNKGEIHDFKTRLLNKLQIISEDLTGIKGEQAQKKFDLISGSCLTKLHDIPSDSVDMVVTSPPYCNRYDYTRTYALELAFCGVDDKKIKELRQTLLSATVENKSKYNEIKESYNKIGKSELFEKIAHSFRTQPALNEILENLRLHRDDLNNKNIPNMISNYFFEMNFVINELSRTLRPNGKVIMVNDNVQYNGSEIPVDLILSEFADKAGLKTDFIWILERGKGNSSQQMGVHGRNEIRKCVYVWSKN